MLAAAKDTLKKFVDKIPDYLLNRDSRNILRSMQRRALEETASFVEENMYLTKAYSNKFDLMAAALDLVPKTPGLCCEFGVYSGATINFIADRLNGLPVYGFDSFQGLPEDWRPGVEKGSFHMKSLPKVRNNVTLLKGWFDNTLPGFLRDHPGTCRFLHIDCDLYSSTKTVFTLMADRIEPGTVIVFDEFFNYPGWKKGEYLAFQELLSAQKLEFEYLGYVTCYEQVAVRITGKA